jgi:DNA-binding NarL/FixJ family response regulator
MGGVIMGQAILADGISAQFSGNAFLPAAGSRVGAERASRTLLLIDKRIRDRECLARSIAARRADMNVLALGSLEEWTRHRDLHPPLAAVLLNIGGSSLTTSSVASEVRNLTSELGATPVVAMADSDDLREIYQALDCGVRGYIPSTLGIAVCMEAISLALAGGIFVPANSVLAAGQKLATSTATVRQPSIFTTRQAEVVEALRYGKANKIIAYELKMQQSTVKVHIRNVMRKLKATNRTEVVYKINELLQQDAGALG